ncbi:U-box domain-containing protein 21-like [Impatiens glandulifera]|uniref:U-box domain-containing protein 21-like n=1 Tax=Impatiens glandulifera TaxID=253017 RepID=UPI001FB1652E|nr:U-box domain-containing protein 21-like [Impatiens glandulifera]
MVLSWRRSRKSGRISAKKDAGVETPERIFTTPTHFLCPISLDLMKDPVTLSTGITYDRESIEKWVDSGNKTCPVTNQTLTNFDQIPNHAIRKMIQLWCVENKSQGIERIPTPRIPITKSDVSDICSNISISTARKDHSKCIELVNKVKRWMRESEKNRKCLIEGGVGDVLSTAFEFFTTVCINENDEVLSVILSALPSLFPISEEAQTKLVSVPSIRCMARYVKKEDPNSVLLLKELTVCKERNAITITHELLSIEEMEESLMKIVKLQLTPRATKAALTLIYQIITIYSSSSNSTRFANADFVSILIDLIVDSERSLCEMAMAVMDAICLFEVGRKRVKEHAMTMPVMVKKLLRVSGMATELSVSVIWRLCKNDEAGCCVEAIKLGCFQKLLVVLQVGCGGKTKEKVSELLKMMNQYRGKLECFDSTMNLKHINRPSF